MKKPAKVKENAPTLWRIPPLRADDHKYTRGHVLIYGGAEMTGAARLAALAAQRAGAGLVTIAVPRAVWPIYAASMLSVITRACDAAGWKQLVADNRINPVLLGPGAGADARLATAIRAAASAGKTLILDADAITLLARDAGLRKKLIGHRMILTPHEGEYLKLAQALKLDSAAPAATRATALAKALGATILLKGPITHIAAPDGRLIQNTANAPWLATGGTGDVLAGIIAGLVGQGMDLFAAASAGVWLHSEAARQFGPGMVAEDIIGSIPKVLHEI